MRRKAILLGINRSNLYYKEKEVSNDTVTLMNEIIDLYTQHPFMGYRGITELLKRQGYPINRKRIQRLMQKMGLQAIYPKINLSKRRQEDAVFPYLLKKHPPLFLMMFGVWI